MPSPAHGAPPPAAAHTAVASPRRARQTRSHGQESSRGPHSSLLMEGKATHSCKHSHHSEKRIC